MFFRLILGVRGTLWEAKKTGVKFCEVAIQSEELGSSRGNCLQGDNLPVNFPLDKVWVCVCNQYTPSL